VLTRIEGVELDQQQKSAAAAISRRWWLVVPAFLVAALLAVGGWIFWDVARYQAALNEISADMGAGRHGLAARRLGELLASKPGSDDLLYLLGVCERTRGQAELAEKAWAQVPADSRFWGQATQGRTELKIQRGQLAGAEQLILRAQRDAPAYAHTLNALLANVYGVQGRLDEAARLIEAEWDALNSIGEGTSEKAINLVRLEMQLQRMSAAPEGTRAYIEQALVKAPDDDRVSLGRANLAIRAGSLDEAARLLDACLLKQPDDLPIWRAKLNLALAANQLTAGLKAMRHLPGDDFAPAEIHKLAAWIARERGQTDSETTALERLIAADPASLPALVRLADLAARSGRPERAAEYREEQTKIAQRQARRQVLFDRNQPIRDAEELARLGLKLGLRFEARVFLTIALAEDPRRADLSDELDSLIRPTSPPSGHTLAEIVDAELSSLGDSRRESRNRTSIP
jgi:thioredoxin-like negative regulator of GroEL